VDQGQQNCDDKQVCTDDACIATTGCVHNNNTFQTNCYTGPPATVDIGICHSGKKSCKDGSFGACIGEQLPKVETCANGVDDDCDKAINEEGATGCKKYYLDFDGDTFGVAAKTKCLCKPSFPYTATKAGDCDDSNKFTNPAQSEKCNGFDDNCNGAVDEDGATGCTTYYRDNDNDGYGQTNDKQCKCKAADPYDTTLNGDCDDANSAIKPNAKELCDGIDNDCDDNTDEDYDKGNICKKGIGTCQNQGKKICSANKLGTICNVTGKPAGTSCLDSNLCTYGDTCSGGDNSSCSGTAYSCNDNKSCTTDKCVSDTKQQCSNTVNNGTCLIGNSTCYKDGDSASATGNGACKICNSKNNKTAWTYGSAQVVCRPSTCVGTLWYKTDYCNAGQGTCGDGGTQQCDQGNVCKNYSCSAAAGCSESNKGNNTKCGGEFCIGQTWNYKDVCINGSCKDNGTKNCAGATTSCTNGYCDGGCKIQHLKSGHPCGDNKCKGQTIHFQDTCNGSGSCLDGGAIDCAAKSTECRVWSCSDSIKNCTITNKPQGSNCTNDKSAFCASGNVWHFQDTCDSSGNCTDKGSTDCDKDDTTCRDYYCDGGCTYLDSPTSTICKAKSCSNSCKKINNSYCNSGSCVNGGTTACGGGSRCTGGNCTSSCSSNGQCCDTSGNNYSCIGSQCKLRQGCGGSCDSNDVGDCTTNYCVNCSGTYCKNKESGWRCYNNYSRNSACDCESYDAYNNCIQRKNCWHC